MVVAATALVALEVAAASTSHRFHEEGGSSFVITSTISSSDSSQVSALLYPGVTRYLWYTAHNSSDRTIVVTSMSISQVVAPSGCPLPNLDYSQTTFQGSLTVPAGQSNSVAVPLVLLDTPTNQDSCQGTTFNFKFVGQARGSRTYKTDTDISSSLDPVNAGESVTYVANVTTRSDQSVGPPTGTVSFYDGENSLCSNVPLVATGATSDSAQCTPPAYATAGTHFVKAIYSNTDGTFEGSSSPILEETVQSLPVSTETNLVSSPNPSPYGSSVLLRATVTAPAGASLKGGSVYFYLGTPNGAHSLIATGQLDQAGSATFVDRSLPVGVNTLYATYVGNNSFAASASALDTQVVQSNGSHCDSLRAPLTGSGTFSEIGARDCRNGQKSIVAPTLRRARIEGTLLKLREGFEFYVAGKVSLALLSGKSRLDLEIGNSQAGVS